MNSYIIAGNTAQARAIHLTDKISSQTELIHLKAEKSSITIKQIKDLWEPLSISTRIPRIVWIEEANQLTIPAQNALLKMLEEPPENTEFYLSCDASSSLLPTIRSRCETIILKGHEITTTNHLSKIKTIMSLSPGDRLQNIDKRDRAESLLWLAQIGAELSAKLGTEKSSQSLTILATIASLARDAHLALKSNCSVSLVTQNFYLLLPHTRSTR